MILVVLGTEKYKFTRPLLQLDAYLKRYGISERVIVQSGYTSFYSERMEISPFFAMSKLENLVEQARVIISHGGTGSVVSAVKKGKKVIAVPRLKKYNEHIDDHQIELVEIFAKKGYIIPWFPNDNLENIFLQVEKFIPKRFESGKKAILDFVANFIDGIE